MTTMEESTMDDQTKWNDKHARRIKSGKIPGANPVLADQIPVTENAVAIDLACGLGANALMLADRGYTVTAFDVSDTATDFVNAKAEELGRPVKAKAMDLTSIEGQTAVTATAPVDLAVITYYLDRDLMELVKDLIRPGGYVFIETYVSLPGMENTPVREDFKLHPAELVNSFEDWGIMYFDFDETNGTQTILVRKKTTHH
ncbi:class I SAM-dependent methyltransferase [Salisediminibacterium selenitireducens]|uniref:Methyltransferase type 12 n=1 Tax=Bacillus selenitireducens (strain ATCC 700615 / DSM 15326 / MLS10) TaxID=439292 RepID=D6XVU7_BACIE|nr:class I SAM-dependent methyltransferase [Salisediminibacterium selenitireducens]ADH97720.1 Methyltransferase type 12 [[Bacillus] selenitireducens MLS10]